MVIQLNLEPTQVLNTYYKLPKVFFIIGAGGTGGYFIPNVTRQIAIQNKLRKMEELPPHKIVIIDQDIISPSNLNRQNFIQRDLDRNKAEVMAVRYGTAFETPVQFLEEYITSTDMLVNICRTALGSLLSGKVARKKLYPAVPVIVDCVDNNKTRTFMHEAVLQLANMCERGAFSLSSGNEFYNGQIVCGFVPSSNNPDQAGFRTPLVGEMFPEILEGADKLPTELSCDEAAVSHPQNIMTNITAATELFNFANIILTASSDNELNPGLHHFAITFDTQTGTRRTFHNKKSIIEQFVQ